MNFFKKLKKNVIAPKSSYTAMLLYYSFFDTLLSSGPKKKWKLKNNPRLPTLSYFLHTYYRNDLPAFENKNYLLQKLLKIDFLNIIKHY